MTPWWETLLLMSAGGTAMGLLLLLARRAGRGRVPSRIFYAAWLLVWLRLLLPVPALLTMTSAVSLPERERTAPAAAWQTEIDRLQTADPWRPVVAPSGDAEHVSSPAEVPAETVEEPAGRAGGLSRLTPDRGLLFLWLAGAAGLFLWYGIGYMRFARPVRRSLSQPPARELGIYCAIEGGDKADIARSALVKGPLLLGVLRPVIVLPVRQYSEEELDSILRHELTHYRRRDAVWKWLGALVHCVHWFNPFLLLFLREADSVCELSCDESMLRRMGERERRAYGEMLLRLAAENALPRRDIINTLAGEKKDLKDRLEQIRILSRRRKAGTAAGLAVLLLLCGCAAVLGPSAPGEGESAAPVVPDAVSVTSVDELLAFVGPDRTVTLAPGKYELHTAADYGTSYQDGFYTWVEMPTGYTLELRNLSNFTLLGPGREEALVCTAPRHADVLTVADSENVEISGVTLGHTEAPGWCTGGVVAVEGSTDVVIRDCELFGCGILGLDAVDSTGVTVADSHILDCSQGAVKAERCRDVRVENCRVEQCGVDNGVDSELFSARQCSGFAVVNCTIRDNQGTFLLHSDASREVYLLGSWAEGNRFLTAALYMEGYPDPAVVDGCGFSDNEGALMMPPENPRMVVPVDIGGGRLDETALANMKHRAMTYAGPEDGPIPEDAYVSGGNAAAGTESAYSSTGFITEEVTVYTVDEFLEALDNRYTIITLGAEEYDLSTAAGYGSVDGRNYSWQQTAHGPQLVISGFPDLWIASALEGGSSFVSGGHSEDVLTFNSCRNLFLYKVSVEHRPDEYSDALGAGIFLDRCDTAVLQECRFTASRVGAVLYLCRNVWITDAQFSHCYEGAAAVDICSNVFFSGCAVQDCGDQTVQLYASVQVLWDEQEISEYELFSIT